MPEGFIRKMLSGHARVVWSVAVSPDTKIIASAGSDNNVILWDYDKGKEIATLRGHNAGITSLEFSADGSILASRSFDRSIYLWSVDKAQPIIKSKEHMSQVTSIAFSPNVVFSPRHDVLATGAQDRTIRIIC